MHSDESRYSLIQREHKNKKVSKEKDWGSTRESTHWRVLEECGFITKEKWTVKITAIHINQGAFYWFEEIWESNTDRNGEQEIWANQRWVNFITNAGWTSSRTALCTVKGIKVTDTGNPIKPLNVCLDVGPRNSLGELYHNLDYALSKGSRFPETGVLDKESNSKMCI